MIEQIKSLIETQLNPLHIEVTGDGSHFQVTVVSSLFENMKPVKKQQTIYAIISDFIADGSIHAVSIKAYSEAEWKNAQKFM